MSTLVSNFGVDLNASKYELHPSPKDSVDILQGNYCSAMKFSDHLSTQILDFVSNNKCHYGMKIGTVEFLTDKKGKISFEKINQSLSNCTLTVTKESNVNTEIYETEYDQPPSNAMFLRRKGFVHSKLLIKRGLSSNNNSSLRIRNPVATKRATTTFKEVKGSQKFQRKKRMLENINYPRNKRLKINRNNNYNNNYNITLEDAIGEILYVEQSSFDKIKNVIQSRTIINLSNISIFENTLNKMANYWKDDKCYYLKKEYHKTVNWENSYVLTKSEKQKIENRRKNKSNNNNKNNKNKNNNGILTEEQKFEKEYGLIKNESTYNKYDEIYQKKFSQRTTYLKSINENSEYFKKMRALIKAELDNDKKQKMKQEFRQIFESRKQGIKDMKKMAGKIRIELTVIKNRINTYVKEQQQLQQKNANMFT